MAGRSCVGGVSAEHTRGTCGVWRSPSPSQEWVNGDPAGRAARLGPAPPGNSSSTSGPPGGAARPGGGRDVGTAALVCVSERVMCYSLGTLGQETDGRSGCSWGSPRRQRHSAPRPSHGWPGAAVVFGAGTGAAGVTRPSPPALTKHGPSRHPLPIPPAVGGGTFSPGGRPRRPLASWGGGTSYERAPSPPKALGWRGVVVSAVCLLAGQFGQATDRGSRVILGGSPGAAGPWLTYCHGPAPLPRGGGGVLSASMAFRPSTQGVPV